MEGEYWGVHGGGLYHSRGTASPRARCRSRSTGSSGRRTRRGSRASPSWSSSTTSTPASASSTRDAADLEEVGGDRAQHRRDRLAWLAYDVLCRTIGKRSQAALAVAGTGLVAVAAWASSGLFAPRAAYLQVGVMLGTIMVANVFLVIIPAQRKLVAAMDEGREPDPAPLLGRGTGRCTTTTSTLPVLFTMLTGHFAFVFSADDAWLVFLAIAVLTASSASSSTSGTRDGAPGGSCCHRPRDRRAALWLQPEEAGSDRAGPVFFQEIPPVIAERCATCHSGASAPLGVRLETREQIEARADDTGAWPSRRAPCLPGARRG